MKAFQEIRHYPTAFRVYHKEFTNIGMLAHWHDELEIMYIRRGSAEIVVSDMVVHANEGDLIFCDKHETHYSRTYSQNTTMEYLIFDDSILSNYYQGIFSGNHLIGADELEKQGLDIIWNKLCSTIDNELSLEDIFYRDIVTSEIRSFFYRMARILKSRPEPVLETNKSTRINQNFSEILSYIGDHYSEKITLADLANMLNFSESHFSRLFKRQTGLGFSKFLNYVRVANATDMIKNGETRMVDIALACGFESVRNFNRVFLNVTGCTPTEYSKKPLAQEFPLISTFRTKDGIDSSSQSNPTIIM